VNTSMPARRRSQPEKTVEWVGKGNRIMKQRLAAAISIGVILALGVGHTAGAAVIAADDFLVTAEGQPDNYDQGLLYGQSPTRTGFAASAWGGNISNGGGFDVDSNSGMSWAGNSATYAIDGSGGGFVRNNANANWTPRAFAAGVGDGDEFWGRFLWNPEGESQTFSQEITFNVNGTGQALNNGLQDQFSIRIGGTANTAEIVAFNQDKNGGFGAVTSLSANTTHYVLFQVLVDRSEGGAETLRMWIDPDNLGNIQNGIADSTASLDFMGSGDALSDLYVRMATRNVGMIDELVMGDSMYDVGVLVPEPTSVPLLAAAAAVGLLLRRRSPTITAPVSNSSR
jgi:hypothetical protein